MIYIDEETGRMVNIYAPFKGRSRLDSEEIRAAVGVVEIERDAPPEGYTDHPDWYDVREDWETTQRPYIIYTKKPDEMIAEMQLKQAKAQRQETVDALTVTTSSGKAFDGDETSQDRMARTLQVAEITGLTECVWVLADNVPATVTLAELKEALALSVQAMGAIWADPYK